VIHLIVPFAGVLSEAGREAATTLMLPQLERLLARAAPAAQLGGDPRSLSAPHEVVLARERGWALVDGALPWAAELARHDGIDVGTRPWGLLTPVHLQLGREQVALDDPETLHLDAAASQELFDLVAPLFRSEGIELHWGAPLRWYASHDSLAALPCASLDRVIGRAVDAWLPKTPAARLLRRLQSEVQMLLHDHAFNARRESAGLPVVNSLWLSGCGAAPVAEAPTRDELRLDARLRTPALSEDWVTWREAWHALDAGALAELASAPAGSRLTLAGERAAATFTLGAAPWWRGWRRTPAAPLLDAL
jgi:hypothetical protein